jgi:hypothetical protein
MRDPSIAAAKWHRVATTLFAGGARGFVAGGRGPRLASTSRSTWSMLPRAQGAGAATSSDGEFRAPPGAGPLRVRVPEVPEEARFTSSYLGAPMRRGPPTPGIHWARIFTLFPLPGGRPRRFAPELDLAVVTEAEGSIGLGAWREKWHWRKEMKCWRSRGDSI